MAPKIEAATRKHFPDEIFAPSGFKHEMRNAKNSEMTENDDDDKQEKPIKYPLYKGCCRRERKVMPLSLVYPKKKRGEKECSKLQQHQGTRKSEGGKVETYLHIPSC